GEGLVTARNEHAADLVVSIESLDRLRQLANQHLVERIESLRTVEADNSDTALRFDDDGLVVHGLILIQSSLAPARFTTSAHLAESALIVAANSSGVPPAASSPNLENLSRKASDLIALLIAAFNLSTIGRGTPAGAITPVQVAAT